MEENIFKFITKMDNSNFEIKSYIKFSDSKYFVKNIAQANYIENRRAFLKTFEGYALYKFDIFEVKGFIRRFHINYISESRIIAGTESPTIYMNLFLFDNKSNAYFRGVPLSLISSADDEGFTAQSNSSEVIRNDEIVLLDDNRYKTKLYCLDEDEQQEVEKTWDKKIESAKNEFDKYNLSKICRVNKYRYPVFLKYETENILSMQDEIN